MLVLLHEGLGAITTWHRFPARLAELAGTEVFAYDRRGYGRSDPCPLPRPLTYLEDEAEGDLWAVLDALDAPTVVLVGHSDGGTIAAAHAARPPHRSVVGLVLVAPHVFVEPWALDAIRAAGHRFRSGELAEGLRRHHGENTTCAFRGWHDTWLDPRFPAAFDLRPRLGAIRLPALVVQGTEDPYGSLEQVETFTRGTAGRVTTWVARGVGHAPHREVPEALATSIETFVRSVLSPPSHAACTMVRPDAPSPEK